MSDASAYDAILKQFRAAIDSALVRFQAKEANIEYASAVTILTGAYYEFLQAKLMDVDGVVVRLAGMEASSGLKN